MAKLRRTLLVIPVLAAGTLIGCGGGAYYAGVGVGPPPPPPGYGPVGVAPGAGFIWTNGYYDLVGSRWVWRPGQWRRPPRPGARWVEPRWERHGNGWVRHGGNWQGHRR